MEHQKIIAFRHELVAENSTMSDGMERETYQEIADFIDEVMAAFDTWTKENR